MKSEEIQFPAIKTTCAEFLLMLLVILVLPASVQAQFTFTTNNGALTITGYSDTNAVVIIPDTTNGLPVTSLGDSAFRDKSSVTSVTIPNSITAIGNSAFAHCWNLQNVTLPTKLTTISSGVFFDCGGLTSVTIPDSVIYINEYAFADCRSLVNVVLGEGVTAIQPFAFHYCTSLTSVTIPASIVETGDSGSGSYRGIRDNAFAYCPNLTRFFFKGSAPGWFAYQSALSSALGAVVYYLPGTVGWGPTFRHLPTVLWNPQADRGDASFGARTNRFGFNIIGTANIPLVVEATTNFASSFWVPLQTCTLTNGAIYFSDPQWTNYPARSYRFRSP